MLDSLAISMYVYVYIATDHKLGVLCMLSPLSLPTPFFAFSCGQLPLLVSLSLFLFLSAFTFTHTTTHMQMIREYIETDHWLENGNVHFIQILSWFPISKEKNEKEKGAREPREW